MPSSERTPAPAKPPLWRNAALMALGLFALINLALWIKCGDDKVSHDLWHGAGSIDIAVDKFQQLKEKPHVVLLGSSLMMYPFWAMDKEANAQIGDIFQHRRSITMEEMLAKKGVPNHSVYSFAIFGQMVSDAYIYVNEFLKGNKAPDYIVLGIAPRDFHDNDLPAPMSTYTFKRLVDLNNFNQYANLYLPSLQDKIDWLMGRVCYFYGNRWHLQHEVDRFIGRLYTRFGMAGGEAQKTPAQAQAGFMLAGSNDVRWKSSLAEYKRRYTNIEGKDFDLQFSFLGRLLDVCKQRGIKVIIVNMPLSDVNRQLLPGDFYRRYSARIADMANADGAQYIDLGAAPDFTHNDFWDTTHLNHFGGHKLLGHLSSSLQ